MPEITLNDSERLLLRQCPQTVTLNRSARQTAATLGRLRMIQRLQAARLIRGEIDADASGRGLVVTRLTLTDAGRVALGLPIQGGA